MIRSACVLRVLVGIVVAVAVPKAAGAQPPATPPPQTVVLDSPDELASIVWSLVGVAGVLVGVGFAAWTVHREHRTTRARIEAQLDAMRKQHVQDARERLLQSVRDLASRFIAAAGETDVLFESIGLMERSTLQAEEGLAAGTPAGVQRWTIERSTREDRWRSFREELRTTVRLGEELRFLLASRQDPKALDVVSAIDRATSAVQHRDGTGKVALDKFRVAVGMFVADQDRPN